MKKGLVVVILCMAVIYACKHEVVNPSNSTGSGTGTGSGAGSGTGTGGGNGGGQQSNVVCFESEILPIFRSNCAMSGCHNSTSAQKRYVFETYNGIMEGVKAKDLHESKVYRMITEDDVRKRMPLNRAKLSDTTIKLIARWIMEGANNTTNCNTACDASVFTYSSVIKPIIDGNCVGCHNGGTSAPAALDYRTYEGLKAVALNGRLVGAITHAAGFSPMPKGTNNPKLSECKIEQIKKWVQAGAPNN